MQVSDNSNICVMKLKQLPNGCRFTFEDRAVVLLMLGGGTRLFCGVTFQLISYSEYSYIVRVTHSNEIVLFPAGIGDCHILSLL